MEVAASSDAARRIADAVKTFELESEGFLIRDITVVVVNRTLIIVFEGGLNALERTLAQSASGAAQVEEYHQRLFARGPRTLWNEIQNVLGLNDAEGSDDHHESSMSCVKVFTSGTVVHVCPLSKSMETSVWSETWQPRPAMAAGPEAN